MKRVVFNLTDEQDARLERIARNMGVSKPEALRYVLEFHQVMKESEAKAAEYRRTHEDASENIMEILG